MTVKTVFLKKSFQISPHVITSPLFRKNMDSVQQSYIGIVSSYHIRQNIYSQVATSYIHKDSVSVADKLIYGIWIILFGLILLLTWADMQFSKKSDFLKISMGSSVGKMIFGKILVDIVFNVAIFGAVYAILQSRLFLSYKLNFALYALLIFFVLNSLLYLTLLKVDYKEVIYEEDTPYHIISELQPDVLVKGGDYDATSIVGCDIVKKRGGEIQTVEIKHNTSSTKIIERILNQYKGKNNEPE